jgi:hypothetical protein
VVVVFFDESQTNKPTAKPEEVPAPPTLLKLQRTAPAQATLPSKL